MKPAPTWSTDARTQTDSRGGVEEVETGPPCSRSRATCRVSLRLFAACGRVTSGRASRMGRKTAKPSAAPVAWFDDARARHCFLWHVKPWHRRGMLLLAGNRVAYADIARRIRAALAEHDAGAT